MSPRPSKALSDWSELNGRQQGTLAIIFALDQAQEAQRKRAGAAGVWDRTPAARWRQIDFSHDPMDRKLFGWTEMQARLDSAGWNSQGNGSTLSALATRGLISRARYPTLLGTMRTVTLTAKGRAAARAGTSVRPAPTGKASLRPRAWEVLVLLWTADTKGSVLAWDRSHTIDRVLNAQDPPLAERVPGGYALTEAGRAAYRCAYPVHVIAYPDIRAAHPDGEAAEPWPAAADRILAEHRHRYRALCAAWRQARTDHDGAERESALPAPDSVAGLPESAAALAHARHEVWVRTARERTALAAQHMVALHVRAQQAAHDYAVAAVMVFAAAVHGTNPCEGLSRPGDKELVARTALPAPASTGIHAIDTEAAALHGAATGAPVRRRGPAPKPRSRHRDSGSPEPVLPGAAAAALADALHKQVVDGRLRRTLHPAATQAVPVTAR